MTLTTKEFAKVVTDAVIQVIKYSKINRNAVKEDPSSIVTKVFGYIDYFNNDVSIYQKFLDGVSLAEIEFPKALMSFIEPRAIVKDTTMLEMCKDLKVHHYYTEAADRIKQFSIDEYYDCIKDFLKLFNKWVDKESCGSIEEVLAPVNYSEVSKRVVWVDVSHSQELTETSCVGSAIRLMDEVIPIFVDSRIEFGFDDAYYSSYMNSYSDVIKNASLYINRKLASVLLARN